MKLATLPSVGFRVGRGDPWKLYPPNHQNRFDISNPLDPVATLYLGESEEACFAEILADFRPNLDVLAELEDMLCDAETPMPASKVITQKWREQRSLGSAQLRQTCQVVDLTSSESQQALRNIIRIAKLAREIRCFDIDDAALKASGKEGRRFTQTVAAEIYSQGFDGIRYGSRLGADSFRAYLPMSRASDRPTI